MSIAVLFIIGFDSAFNSDFNSVKFVEFGGCGILLGVLNGQRRELQNGPIGIQFGCIAAIPTPSLVEMIDIKSRFRG